MILKPKIDKIPPTPWGVEHYYNNWPGGGAKSFDNAADDETHLVCKCGTVLVKGPIYYEPEKIKKALQSHRCKFFPKKLVNTF